MRRMPLIAGFVPTLVLIWGSAACAAERAAVPLGRPAPDFALVDSEGREHRLSDYRGRVVVLEWANHHCPATNGYYKDESIPRTRARLGERAVWLTIDSSWFSKDLLEGVRAWRKERSPDAPYLLDPSGSTGRAYGATTTPQFFVVDARGTLVYTGALDDRRRGAPESERRNFVLGAVEALLAGRSVSPDRTEHRGCSVDYVRKAPAGEDPRRAHTQRLYVTALDWSGEGEPEKALAYLGAAFRAGYATPSDALAEPKIRSLRAGAAFRGTLRELLRESARESSVALVDPREPGEPLVVTGTVRDSGGRPVAGALVYVFHTDATGVYSPDGMDETNPRLFGFVKTDERGRYEFRTIRPAHYPDDGEPVEQHVHYVVSAAGMKERGSRLGFRDDPFWARERRDPPWWAAPVERGEGGVARCSHDVTLEPL